MSRQPPSPLAIWREFHWAFFINVQGLIICLGRFEAHLQRGLLTAAEKEQLFRGNAKAVYGLS